MSEIFGVKVGSVVATGAGSAVAAMLMTGPWYIRAIAAVCGATCSYVMTPLITPVAYAGWVWVFTKLGISPEELPRDGVSGFVGFLLGLTGIDICRWMIDQTKTNLGKLKFPWPKKDGG